MKRIIVISLFIALNSIVGKTQDFTFGVQLSPTISWLSSDDVEIITEGRNLGLRLGLIGEYYFDDNYALTAGIGFAFVQGGTIQHEKGGDFWPRSELSDETLNFLPGDVELKYRVQYVEFPFSLKMRTNEFGYFRYFAELPILTLGFTSQARGDILGTNVKTEKENIMDDVNFINLAWGLGIGAEYSVNSDTRIVGGFYFQQGFLDVTDDGAEKFNLDDNGEKVDVEKEDSKGTIGSLTFRIAVLF